MVISYSIMLLFIFSAEKVQQVCVASTLSTKPEMSSLPPDERVWSNTPADHNIMQQVGTASEKQNSVEGWSSVFFFFT